MIEAVYGSHEIVALPRGGQVSNGSQHSQLFNTSDLSESLPVRPFCRSYGWHEFGTAFAPKIVAALQMNCEAVMWKITARGFTLQEVLILAAMNIAARTDSGQANKSNGRRKRKGDVWQLTIKSNARG
jgi:hypothetical protein